MSRGEGWAFPPNAKRDHYFVQWISLCGKWLFKGDFEDDDGADAQVGDCLDCHRRLQRRKVAP